MAGKMKRRPAACRICRRRLKEFGGVARVMGFRRPRTPNGRRGIAKDGDRAGPVQHHGGAHELPGILITELPFIENERSVQ